MNITPDQFIFIIQFSCCVYMTGLISIIQLIHYPSFAQINSTQFLKFHENHSKALSLAAGPIMIVELLSALWLIHTNNKWLILNAVTVVILWLITFLVSVPKHNKLSLGFDSKTWSSLVKTNWLRTLIWWGRTIAFLYFFLMQIRLDL